MRSPVSLGIVFLVLAGYGVGGVPGAHVGVGGYVLAGLLGAAGLVVMTRHRAAYYLGLLAGGATTIVSLIDWSGLSSGRRLGLPFVPAVGVVAGLYLCLRVVLAQSMFGPKKRLGHHPLLDGDAAELDAKP